MEPVFSLKHLKGGRNKTKTNSIDNSAVPSTAYDYLRHVHPGLVVLDTMAIQNGRNEAAACPDIVVANIDCSVFNTNQDPNFIAVETVKTSSGDKEPSAEWQSEQISAFAEIRQCLAHEKALLLKKKEVVKQKLPAAENEQEWFEFCFGKEEKTSMKCKTKAQDSISNTENEVEHNGGTPALLSVICQMNQSTVLSVLDHHIGWLETKPFTLLQGQWIYALLSAVEKPLHPDTTYSLRRLARLCSTQKERLNSEQMDKMAALYLLIVLVMRYFGQNDLAEPF